MKQFAKLYHYYRLPVLKLIRLVFFILFFSLLILELLSNSDWWKISFSLLSIFFIFEIFFHFKVAKLLPIFSIAQNNGQDIYSSFTLQSLEIFTIQKTTSNIIKELLKKEAIKFILQKANITEKELFLMDIYKDELAKFAFSVAKNLNGRFVTTMDIFASYVLTTETKTKLLFSKKLKEEEFLHILHWANINFPLEENPKSNLIHFWGEGIGESWVYGWTIETQKYMEDITPRVLKEKQVLIGREAEYKAVTEALFKSEKNNVILVGEIGTGVTSIVKKLAFDSFIGNLPGRFHSRRFFQLFVGTLLAGTQVPGDLESRLQSVIAEISHSGNITVFIPEFQDIFGASTFHLDLSGALIPYLKNEEIQIVAAVTPGNFKKYIEPMKNIVDLFEVVKIEEPDYNLALQMVLGNTSVIESKNKVNLTYKAIIRALELSNRYMQDKFLPGSAISLLNDVSNSVYLSGKKDVKEEDVVMIVEEKTKIAIGAPNSEEKGLLLHLEDKIHERVIDQKEGVSVIAEALRRIRTGLASQNKPISFLFLGPTGVGKTETAKVLALIYFKGEDKMIRLDMSEYTTDDGIKRLLGAPPGEGDEKGELTEKVHENPFSLVLLDEFEKAAPEILDLFLQVLDDGRLTDNKGKTVSFVNTIIIATSNAGSEFIREEIKKGTVIDKNFQQKMLELLQTKGIFKPELLNRFDAIVVFKPLGQNESFEVVKLLLKDVSKKLLEKDIIVSFDEKIIGKIVKEGMNEEFGARPLRRFIQDNIEDLIAQKMLKDEIKRGDKMIISTDEQNQIIIL